MFKLASQREPPGTWVQIPGVKLKTVIEVVSKDLNMIKLALYKNLQLTSKLTIRNVLEIYPNWIFCCEFLHDIACVRVCIRAKEREKE